MDNKIAATLIVEMVGILAKNGYEDTDYNEAVAIACSALLSKDTNVPVKCEDCRHGAHFDGVVICDKDAQRHERTDGCERGERK